MLKRIAVIGGGAAGLMAAGTASRNGNDVTLFEKRPKVGRKIAITGKGRCNVTNACNIEEFLDNVPQNSKFLMSALNAFTPDMAIEFFRGYDVNLKVERGRRVFPESNRAFDVVDALIKFITKNNVCVLNDVVSDIDILDNGKFILTTSSGKHTFDSVIVCTGGLSYSVTGCTGDGYKFASKFGHTIVRPRPSLINLKIKQGFCTELAGLSLRNVRLYVKENDKTIFGDIGEMLFTHDGISGPLALSASAHIRNFPNKEYKISIDLKPGLDLHTLDKRLLRDFESVINKDFANSLDRILPRKMIPIIIRLSSIPAHLKVHSITKDYRTRLAYLMKNLEMDVAGFGDIEEAIVTSGGINVKEISPKNMQSKLVSGLYFAGEVLDLDAYTGGYNLQIAWSTGYLSGISV